MSWLASVDAEGVTEKQRLDGVAALEALKGAAAAAQARLSAAAVVDREALGEDSRSVRADVALARRCSPTVADQHVGVAKALVGEMPETMAALTRGEISERRAMLMVRETACLSVEHRGVVDQQLASKLATMGDKALAGAARRAGAKLDAESLAARTSRAVASRRMSVRAAADGMAWVSRRCTRAPQSHPHSRAERASRSRQAQPAAHGHIVAPWPRRGVARVVVV